MSETAFSSKRYLTIRQTAQAYPAMTESALRIDADAFERWLETHRDGQAAA
jgi:hypothetical protein